MIASSSKTTTSLIERMPPFKSSPMTRICRITKGERESAFSALSCPRSMHLAMSTSPFTGEQRYCAHLAQVHAHRIVGLFKSVWGQVELAGLYFLLKLFLEGQGWELGLTRKHVNARCPDHGEQVVQVLQGVVIVRNQVSHPVMPGMAFISPGIDEFRNVAKRQAKFLFGVCAALRKGRFVYFTAATSTRSAEIKTERCMSARCARSC